MNTAKKLEYKEDYFPKSLPEIIKLAGEMTKEKAVIYHSDNTPYLFETNRLIIRRFQPEDAQGLCVLANDKESSPLATRDHKWPTDLESCKGIAQYFSSEPSFWAVCIKPSFEIIGMITYNTVDENNMIDLGHVWRVPFMNDNSDTEAISLMVQYAFDKLGASGVFAYNPLDYEAQIHPLIQVGMEIVETFEGGSFANDEHGNPITFPGCKMLITKERWERTV
ncbi:MAG TPA: GNAT family N-acetyltransferase [Lachnospiraceae bacterium]|nr:GNAT family N-acetyltransferase [Lachnospiraceae bacterium]